VLTGHRSIRDGYWPDDADPYSSTAGGICLSCGAFAVRTLSGAPWPEPAVRPLVDGPTAEAVADRMTRLARVRRRWSRLTDLGFCLLPVLTLLPSYRSGRWQGLSVAVTANCMALVVLLLVVGSPGLVRRLALLEPARGDRDGVRGLVFVGVVSVVVTGMVAIGWYWGHLTMTPWTTPLVQAWQLQISPEGLHDRRTWGLVIAMGGVQCGLLLLLQSAREVIAVNLRRFQEAHDPVIGVGGRLVEALDLLDRGSGALLPLRSKVTLIRLLDGAAENLEVMLRRVLGMAGSDEAKSLARCAAAEAARLRGWSLEAALPDIRTGQEMADDLQRLLGIVVSGQYGRFARPGPNDPLVGSRSPRSLLRPVVVGLLPLGIVLAADALFDWPTGQDGEAIGLLRVFAVVWAVLSLLVVVDTGLEQKLTLVKTFSEVVASIRSWRSDKAQSASDKASEKGKAAAGPTDDSSSSSAPQPVDRTVGTPGEQLRVGAPR
jgi:hypothetical protein